MEERLGTAERWLCPMGVCGCKRAVHGALTAAVLPDRRKPEVNVPQCCAQPHCPPAHLPAMLCTRSHGPTDVSMQPSLSALSVVFADPFMELLEGKISWKKLLTFLLFSFIFSFCLFASLRQFRTPEPEDYNSYLSTERLPAGSTSMLPKSERMLTILLWTWPFGQRFNFSNCSELFDTPNCHFTTNRSWSQKADAVIMHHRDVYWDRERLARIPRLPSQRWIWFNMESPSHSPNLGAMDHLFNLTMSYRRDSDIFTPYGELQLLSEPQPFSIPPKTKMVAWVVSNWRPSSHRVKYYEELKKHIPVDVYGRQHLPLSMDMLHQTVSQYNFYLAFENSEHKDYITEKLWRNALSSGTIPVVLGPPRENYEHFLPPDSFIHVDDFASAGELAQYLQELSRDTEKYQRYFQWRRWLKPVLGIGWAMQVCRACHFLQRTEASYHVVPNLSKWFV